MSTITPAAVIPVAAPFNTSPSYSGTFIPTLWSSKLNAKFYAASTFADICNRDWEGDIKNLGDKVVINGIPSITINDYTVGSGVSYQVPTPSTIEMVVDRAKYFGFQINDVLDYQSKPDLMGMFTDDASEQMRTVLDSTCLYRTLLTAESAVGKEDGTVPANRGATAGKRSTSYNLGTDAAPVDISAANEALNVILRMASVLDEQNIPESGRWLLIDPATRLRLMGTNLAQAQFMGDDKSMVRNGLIGTIDRFKVYVTNQLPFKAATAVVWTSGDGSETSIAGVAHATLRTRILAAGHTSAISFASQMTKTEQLRNPTDFGDYVRGLQVFGHKTVKGTALATAIVSG